MQTIQACITRRTWATLKELEGQEAKDCVVYWYDAPSGSPQVSSFGIQTAQGWYELYQDYQLLQDEGEYAFLMCQKRPLEEGKEGYKPAHAIYSAAKPGGERVFLVPTSLQLTGAITNVTLVRDELEIKQGEKEPWHLSADVAVRLDIAGSTIAIEADDTDVWCVRYRRFGEELEDFAKHWRFKVEGAEEIIQAERVDYPLTGEAPVLTLPPKPTPEPREPKPAAPQNRFQQGDRRPPRPQQGSDRPERPFRGPRPAPSAPQAARPGEQPPRADRAPRGGANRRGPRPPRDARENLPQTGAPRPPRAPETGAPRPPKDGSQPRRAPRPPRPPRAPRPQQEGAPKREIVKQEAPKPQTPPEA